MELKKGLDVSPCDERTVGHRGGDHSDSGLSSFGGVTGWGTFSWGNVRTQCHHQRAGYPHGIN